MALPPIPGIPDILMKLEEFFSSPSFTTAIGNFLGRETPNFTSGFDLSAEQPLAYYDVYHKYQKLVESTVDEFLGKEGVTSEALFTLIENCQRSSAAGALTCLDYMIASTEYDHFLRLVADFACMDQWGTDEETAPGELLEGLEDSDCAEDDDGREECGGGGGAEMDEDGTSRFTESSHESTPASEIAVDARLVAEPKALSGQHARSGESSKVAGPREHEGLSFSSSPRPFPSGSKEPPGTLSQQPPPQQQDGGHSRTSMGVQAAQAKWTPDEQGTDAKPGGTYEAKSEFKV